MDIDRLLRRQDGVISLRQATAAGLSARGVRHRVTSGRWRRVHPRVYHCADRELTHPARLRAAVLWASPRAAVTGLAAAWWHGLSPRCPSEIEITVARDRQPGRQPGVRVRRRTLAERDLVRSRGLWTTDVPLTAIEAAVAAGQAGGELLDRALQTRVDFQTVYRAHCRNLGRYGSPEAAALLAGAADGAASTGERRLLRLLRDAGLTGYRVNYPLNGYLVDVAFPAHRVAVEVDGSAWHHGADRFRADRRRQNGLVLAGWTVLRFTWDDLTCRPRTVVAEIRSALAAAAAS